MKRFLILLMLVPAIAYSYELEPGDWLLRPQVGARVNVVRFESVTRPTPLALLSLGFEGEYMIDKPLGFVVALRPMVTGSFVDLALGFGPKFRFLLDSPLIPYVGAQAEVALLLPTGVGAIHWNIGARVALGLDYFVMNDFAVGLELATIPSAMLLAGGQTTFELGVEALVGFMWRI